MGNFFEVMIDTFSGLCNAATAFWEVISTPLYQLSFVSDTTIIIVNWLLEILGFDEANKLFAAFMQLTLLEASLLGLAVVYCVFCVVRWVINIFR